MKNNLSIADNSLISQLCFWDTTLFVNVRILHYAQLSEKHIFYTSIFDQSFNYFMLLLQLNNISKYLHSKI